MEDHVLKTSQEVEKSKPIKILQWIYLFTGIVYIVLGFIILTSIGDSLINNVIFFLVTPLPFFVFASTFFSFRSSTIRIIKIFAFVVILSWLLFSFIAPRIWPCEELGCLFYYLISIWTIPHVIASVLYLVATRNLKRRPSKSHP